MGQIERNIKAISPVLAVLMMIAVAIAGSLVVYAWIMGYIGVSTERSGEAIQIQNVFNDGNDLLVYVQNVGEGVVQFDEDECLYMNGILVPCIISGVIVSDDMATLSQGETATLRYAGGVALPGEKVKIKVTTLHGTPTEKYVYPAGTAQAPPGTVIWNRTYGGFWSDSAWSVIETSDGGYAVAGRESSFGSGIGETMDAWLVKIDSSGNVQWNRTYGEPGPDWAASVIETSDGGYALAGYTASYGVGEIDAWLVKTDASGYPEWNRTYGGTEFDVDSARTLVETSDGGYAIAGYTETFGAGGDDFWLIKTDSLGNAEWNRTYGGTEGDSAYSMVTTSDGGYAIAGETNSFGAGADDFWLVKTDEFGNMEWNQTYGGTEGDHVRSLVETSNGGYVIAGSTQSFGVGPNTDFWVVKTN